MSDMSTAARIAVTFQQNMSYTGSFLRKPILSVSVLLPEDAEPFELIKAGDLEGLLRSLFLKKSRLTDRDVRGRCLLNVSTQTTRLVDLQIRMTQCEQYAIAFMKPDICKFLVDEGADVDFIERDHSVDAFMSVLESTRNSMSVLLISLACPRIL